MGINVAVTGLHAADNPAPGIGVLRSLRYPNGWDGELIGLAYDTYDTGIYDRHLMNHAYLIPYPNQGKEQVFERIRAIHKAVGIDVLIPTLDSELQLYQQLESELKGLGIAMYLPSADTIQKRAKSKLLEFCKANDIETPKTIVINDPRQFGDALDEIGFPLYVKGVFYDAYACYTRDEALKQFEKLRLQWGLPALIQEAINGEEFDICAMGDDEGNLLGSIPMRKLRLTDKGKAWSAITLNNPRLTEFSKKTMKALSWRGPCELEILQESKSRKLYLLEINPRFPAWIFLGAGANQNLPKLAVELALGKRPEPLPPVSSGITFVRHATDLICPLEYIENLTINGELHFEKQKM
ncbi:MAG TPA: biotin carboxylase [Candidatus Marinimicrobia bacterium]|nr:biotin carboxylase [Candidatus Neomarinimicrobiota bacterium]